MSIRTLALTLMTATLSGCALFAQPVDLDEGPELETGKDYFASIYTTHGQIDLDLLEADAPIAVRNFVNLAEGTREFVHPKTKEPTALPFYNGIMFHRVIPNFMVQFGDPTGTGRWSPGFTFPGESAPGLTFDQPGLVGTANPGDPDKNGSQFFITEVPTPHLNGGHTILGKTLNNESLNVVKGITASPRDNNDKPLQPIVIERVAIYRLDPGLTPEEAKAKMSEIETEQTTASE